MAKHSPWRVFAAMLFLAMGTVSAWSGARPQDSDSARLAALMAEARFATGTGDQKAVAGLTEAIGLAERLGDKAQHAEALRLLALNRLNAGATEDALIHGRAAADLFRALGDHRNEVLALRTLATATTRQQQPEESLALLDRALEAASRSADPLVEASVWSARGAILASMRRWAPAQTAMEAAIARFEPSGGTGLATALRQLALLLKDRGHMDQALRTYERALATARQVNDLPLIGVLNGNIGNLYHALGQFERAATYHHESLAGSTAMKRPRSMVFDHIGLAADYVRLARAAQAEHHAMQAQALSRELGDPILLANSLLVLSHLRLNLQRQPVPAEQTARDVLAIPQVAKDADIRAQALGLLSAALQAQGRHREALPFSDEAVSLVPAHGILDYEARVGRAGALLKVGELARAESDVREAYAMMTGYRRLLTSDAEKGQFAETAKGATVILAAVLAAQGRLEASLEVAESHRARGLADLLAQRVFEGKPASRDALAAVRASADRERDELIVKGPDVRGGTSELDASLARLRREGPELASLVTAEAPTFAQIAADAARLDATFVEYLIERDEAHVWVVSPQGEVRHTTLPTTEHDVSTRVATVRERLSARVSPDARLAEALRALHARLIDPIAKWLPSDPAKTVVIVPATHLQLLPFATLLDSAGTPLVARHTLAFAPSLGVFGFTAQKRRAGSNAAVVVSDPVPPDPSALPALPGARREGPMVARRLASASTVLLEGPGATETATKRRLSRANTIHFATHGLISPQDPSASSLVLGQTSDDDGYLTVSEVFGLELEAQLVVLSGCSTNVGPTSAEGIAGLVRAFIYAGAPTVVASLWDVGDRSTETLMDAFYRARQRGMPTAAALRAAQLATRRQYAHPAQWAAFQLTGEPR